MHNPLKTYITPATEIRSRGDIVRSDIDSAGLENTTA